MTKKLLITGNHHTPAFELINQLKQDNRYQWQFFYLTSFDSTNTHIDTIKTITDQLYQIDCGKFHRFSLIKTIKDIPKTITALYQSYLILTKLSPDIIVSFGGYISVPVVIVAWLKRIYTIVHEQTLTISLSTRISSFFANKICLSFKETKNWFFFNHKTTYTGNLLRQQIYNQTTKAYQSLISQIKNKPLIYISGGNQSSQLINQTIFKILNKLTQKYTVIHHIGKHQYKIKPTTNYYPSPYIDSQDIGWVLNNASLIINRAGANNCQEIAALKKKAIIIPLAISQQNEQLKNALWLKKRLPQTIIINQQQLSASKLYKSIIYQLSQPNPPIRLSPKTNFKLLKLILAHV